MRPRAPPVPLPEPEMTRPRCTCLEPLPAGRSVSPCPQHGQQDATPTLGRCQT